MTEAQAHDTLKRYAVLVPDELLNFARAMDEADDGPSVDGWTYFLTRPEKWAAEYVHWHELGAPHDGDVGFEPFCDYLKARDNA